MDSNPMALSAIVSGLVQGVYFRQSCADEANKLGLSGWVMNLDDGSVLVYGEGPQAALERLVTWCLRGPVQARVEDVSPKWVKPQGATGPFVVRR